MTHPALVDLREQSGPNGIVCLDNDSWWFPQEDGKRIIPKGCACKNFPVLLDFFFDGVVKNPAVATRLKKLDNGMVETTNKVYEFENAAPFPLKIAFEVPPAEPSQETPDVVGVRVGGGGGGGFTFIGNDEVTEADLKPFDKVPLFISYRNSDCVVAGVSTLTCYEEGDFSSPCDCSVCGYSTNTGSNVIKAVLDQSLDGEPACVDVCGKLK